MTDIAAGITEREGHQKTVYNFERPGSSVVVMAGVLVENTVDDSRIRSLLPGTGTVKTLSLGLIFILLSRRQSVPVELEFVRGSVFVRLFDPS